MPRGRGSAFRGRGSTSRGRGSRGRGRGRGRGSQLSRWGPNRKFDSARLAEKGEEDAESEASDTPDEALEDVLSDDDDDEDRGSARPYMDLMQQLSTESSARGAKRRKTAHQPAPRETAAPKDEEEEAEESGREDVDQPDEAEDVAEENPAEDSEDEADSTDPFDAHFAHLDEQVTAAAVAAAKEGEWTTKRAMLQQWRATVQFAGAEGTMPQPVTGLDGLKLKRKLLETARHKMRGFDAEQRSLAGALFDYRDVLFCDRTVDNADRLRQTVCLHALNHVFKTRDRVIKNNFKLAKAQDADLEFRDQGFTRPKVLFLLPTRNSCAKVMQVIEDLVEPDQQENIKRFNESYRDAAGETFGADRPADFKELFGANDDDMFRIGIKFTRKTIKYFSPFYSSDVLLASPLGLRMAMGSEEEKGRKGTDHDFLSSIEMVVVDQADALLMQNWEHVEYVLEHLNRQPREARDCDFSRVRSWYLDGWARYLRQTVVLSAFLTPELAELQRLHCHNTAGKLRLLPPEAVGVIGQLGVKARQTFSRFACASLDREPDARFDYFTSAVIPWLTKRLSSSSSSSSSSSGGTVIFIPSYLDFVRVRNWFSTADAVSSITFGVVSEYTDVREASRARSHFVSGRHRVLLYTERAHHFRRYHFSGASGVVFYGLPDNPLFYREIAGGFLARSERELTLEPGRGTVRGVFSRYDAMKLERIVGTARVGKMLQDRGDTFDFV